MDVITTVMSGALFSPDLVPGIQARELNFCLIASETLFPSALRFLSELSELEVASDMTFTQD